MARGRMITNQITLDKDVDALSSDTTRLMFTWMITLADREGRTYGDPAIVKSSVFPRRRDITAEQVENYLHELANLGLIIWYKAKNDLYIFFPAFVKNQRNMRPEREPESEIPAPPDEALQEYIRNFAAKKPEVCRQLAGMLSAEVEVEEKEKLKGSRSGSRSAARNDNDDNDQLTEDEPAEGVAELAVAFEDATGLKQPISNSCEPDWSEEYTKMLARGVEPDDISLAVEELTEKNYNIVGPSSIAKAVQLIVTRRLAKERAHDSHRKYRDWVEV